MEERPRIIIKPTPADIIIEVFSWLALILLWGYAIRNYSGLPERIPTHFNVSGHVDGYGHKSSIFFLPVIGAVISIAIFILSSYPHIFNYPVAITKMNAEKQYRNSIRIMRYLKFFIAFTFLILEYQTIQMVRGQSKELGIWFLPVTLGLIIIPVVFSIIIAVRAK